MPSQNNSNKKRYFLFVVRIIIWLVLSYIFVDQQNWLSLHRAVSNLLSGIYVIVSVSIIVSIGRFVVLSVYRGRHRDMGDRNNFVLGVSRIGTIINAVFLVIGLMLVLGINPKEFLTSITIVAMAIALLFREYITNMISGLIIMFSSQYSLGDWIKWDSYEGEIVDITLANIVVKNEEDDLILVPNNQVFTSSFINRSANRFFKLNVRFSLPLTLPGTPEQLKTEIVKVLEEYDSTVRDEHLRLNITALDQEYIHYKCTLDPVVKSQPGMKELEQVILTAVVRFKESALQRGDIDFNA